MIQVKLISSHYVVICPSWVPRLYQTIFSERETKTPSGFLSACLVYFPFYAAWVNWAGMRSCHITLPGSLIDTGE
ncbi:hypothetical protein P691DRAFT_202186 [Macrolepiota fuliginosa MF-IS2]|uniref:Uncharacterized protein n=1 Tax=Macrolepiota fuliginosa MF-IS2 TaxID=1400762 RepID=A0A9P5XQ03_9AGAR|nr:hypothetical protein P691DRAFT_202186 [Macrolepiota fuliginosa MF-IS2]